MGYSALLEHIVIYMCSGSLYELHAESNTNKCRKKDNCVLSFKHTLQSTS